MEREAPNFSVGESVSHPAHLRVSTVASCQSSSVVISPGILERALRGIRVDASEICRKSRDGIVSGGSPDTIQSGSLLVDFPCIVQVAKFSGVPHNASTREPRGSFRTPPACPAGRHGMASSHGGDSSPLAAPPGCRHDQPHRAIFTRIRRQRRRRYHWANRLFREPRCPWNQRPQYDPRRRSS